MSRRLVTRTNLSPDSGVAVTDTDPMIVIWAVPDSNPPIVAVYDDGTIEPHPDGAIITAYGEPDPFASQRE